MAPKAKLRLPPSPPRLTVKGFGPIREADLRADSSLTVLVGPQASGKSILLQLLKLLVDAPGIKAECKRAGIDWGKDFDQFLDVFFGEGMRGLWNEKRSSVSYPRGVVKLPDLIGAAKARKAKSLFYIPAQRVLAIPGGWPQSFAHYNPDVPYVVREFSESLRLMMSGQNGADLFPVPRRLKEEFRDLIQEHIFSGFRLRVDSERAQKRMVLSEGENGPRLPYMVWSTGQREFVPLLLGLSWLMTAGGSQRRKGISRVVIEEPEMGLHPRAIAVVLLMIFDLVARGYKVCVSTHSPQVLDAIWALRHLRVHKAPPEAFLEVFDVRATTAMRALAGKVLKKQPRVYYFDRLAGKTIDISNLDPASEDAAESDWGGLSEFSGRANDVVAHAVANADRRPT